MKWNHSVALLLIILSTSCSDTFNTFESKWARYKELNVGIDSTAFLSFKTEIASLLASTSSTKPDNQTLLLEILNCHLLLDTDEHDKVIGKARDYITPHIQGKVTDKTVIFHYELLQSRMKEITKGAVDQIKSLESLVSQTTLLNRYVDHCGQEELQITLAELYFLSGQFNKILVLIDSSAIDRERSSKCTQGLASAKRILYAKALLNSGQTAASLKLLNHEIDLNPPAQYLAEALFQKAIILDIVGVDQDVSRKLILQSAATIYPVIDSYGTQWSKYQFHLLDRLITLGKLEEAVSYALEYRQTIMNLPYPNSQEVKKDLWLSRVNARLAELFSQTGKGTEALKHSDEAIATLSKGNIESKKYSSDIRKQAAGNALRAGNMEKAEKYIREEDEAFPGFEELAKQLEESSAPVSSEQIQMLRNAMYYIENNRVNINVRLNIRGLNNPNLIPPSLRSPQSSSTETERHQQTTKLSEKFAEAEMSANFNTLYLPNPDERNITDSWIEAAYSLFESTSDSLYLESGFKAIEYSRYNFLKEIIVRRKIEDKLPASLKEEFAALKEACTFWYKKETEEGYGTRATDSLQFANNRMNAFLNYYAKDQLYDLKSSVLGAFNSPHFQSSDEIFIHYYLSNEYLYIISRNSGTHQFVRKKIYSDFRSDLEYMINLAMNFDHVANSKTSDSKFDQICEIWNDLLIGGIQTTDNKTLVVFPHRELALVSWDYLDSDKGSNKSYLIQQSPIRYELSASLMTTGQSSPNSHVGKLAAFGAENYTEIATDGQSSRVSDMVTRGAANRLSGAQQEMKEVSDLYNGDLYANTTPQMFLDNCANYDILLISTHGIPVINAKGLSTEILFEIDSNNKTSINDNDLYGRNINSSLVVLSSCQTGIGELIENEGIMSLGRTFIGNGSRSVLTSLHVLPDISSKQIFVDFFKNMSEGANKSKALQMSKVNYLNNHSGIELHPIFWASPAIIGNDESIPVPQAKSMLLWLISGSLITCALLLLYMLKKRKKSSREIN